MRDTYCSVLFNHRFIDPTGRVKPCCRFSDKQHIGTDLDSFKSDNSNELRRMSLAGEIINGCRRCYEEEDSGKKSLRQRYNENKVLEVDPNSPQITWLELSISNECNLKCRMCDSKYSNKWYDEEVVLFGRAHETKKIDMDSIYDIVPTLRHLKITGGEPFVTPAHWKLLEYIVDSGYASQIYLNYSTNCTVKLKGRYLELLNEFKHVELTLSLDSIDSKEFEYLRYPSILSEVLENILEYRSYQFKLQARPTITALNVMYLPETLEWLHKHDIKFNATHLTLPSYLSAACLPQEYKNLIKSKYSKFKYTSNIIRSQCDYILNYMMNNRVDELSEFSRVNSYLDLSRNQSLEISHPELYSIINTSYNNFTP